MANSAGPGVTTVHKRPPLAALWGIEPARGTIAPTSKVPTLAERGAELVLGDGVHLRTSGGLPVRLPAEADWPYWVGELEGWAEQLLSESYRPSATSPDSFALRAYYRLRPFIPRSVQILARRVHARARQHSPTHLRWPIDPLFVGIAEAYLALRILLSPETRGVTAAPRWPSGYGASAVLTHDIEGVAGQSRCRDVMALEREAGVRSCFNFVAERYPVDHALMDEMRADGFEIGSHGIKHDGRKFSSRSVFDERLERLQHYRKEWRVVGFRSPATHRRWAWMPELPFEYDSSYPDTDPFEPIPGGCASPWPFMIGRLVELPVTMPQDHTLWEVLRIPAVPVWRTKLEWLRACGGLITIIVHPDYLTTPVRWREYGQLLETLVQTPGLWRTLPGSVAAWWRERWSKPGSRATLERTGAELHLAFEEGAG